jgi:hypothetical protein
MHRGGDSCPICNFSLHSRLSMSSEGSNAVSPPSRPWSSQAHTLSVSTCERDNDTVSEPSVPEDVQNGSSSSSNGSSVDEAEPAPMDKLDSATRFRSVISLSFAPQDRETLPRSSRAQGTGQSPPRNMPRISPPKNYKGQESRAHAPRRDWKLSSSLSAWTATRTWIELQEPAPVVTANDLVVVSLHNESELDPFTSESGSSSSRIISEECRSRAQPTRERQAWIKNAPASRSFKISMRTSRSLTETRSTSPSIVTTIITRGKDFLRSASWDKRVNAGIKSRAAPASNATKYT